MAPSFRDVWYYPPDIAHDLDELEGLSDALKQEAYACAWEYTRCVIPQYTNWNRYIAFMRIIIMGIIAEFKGELVDVASSDKILGYSLDCTLAELFEGTPGHALMAREYKTFLLITAEKTSKRRDSELFRRYVNGLVTSPRNWFRIRDADALARFTMASALACNDMDDVWLSDEQFELLAEIGDVMYDSVAFYKHRSEGETNSTFAYVPPDQRVEAFRVAREILWALDVSYAVSGKKEGVPLINFVRFFGGPIHMMMRRYRFVEEDLSVGRAETNDVVEQTRRNVKLWNRVDATELYTNGARQAEGLEVDRYHAMLKRSEDLMFPGLADILERAGTQHCNRCTYRASYGAKRIHKFGGVELCNGCQAMWRGFVSSLPARAQEVFSELVLRSPPAVEGANCATVRLTDDDSTDYVHHSSGTNAYQEPRTNGAMEAKSYINGTGSLKVVKAALKPREISTS